jgi:arylsulfatase A-like enzyme
VIPGPASLADVAPTLLGLAGITRPTGGVGIDLFDPAQADPERPVVSWDEEARTVTLASARFTYHARLPDGVDWNPERLDDELLVDTVADPKGNVNVAAREPRVLERMRRAALAYLRIYTWLVVNGRAVGRPTSPVSGSAPPPGR